MVSREELQFRERLLKEKQKKFKDFVLLASASLGLPKPPKVKFWEKGCPHGKTRDEIAHIHPETGVICISKIRLEKMNMDEIEETAAHEVTHMIEHAHDDNFYIKHSDTKLGSWLLSRETDTGKGTRRKTGKKPRKTKNCEYHLCEEKPSKLHKCKFCGKNFCKKHASPKVVSMVHSYIKNNPEWSVFFDKERERKDGHPCFPYTSSKFEEIKSKEKESYEKLFEALDKMRGKEFKFPEFTPLEPTRKTEITIGAKKPFKTIVIICIMALLVYFFFVYNIEILNFFESFFKPSFQCQPSYKKSYELSKGFVAEPEEYCKNSCNINYNVSSYKTEERNDLTICYCDINNCKS